MKLEREQDNKMAGGPNKYSSSPDDLLDPGLPDDQTPNFLGYSRGQLADSSLGTLFGGIGDTIGGLAKTVDTFFKQRSSEEITAVVDQNRDRYLGINMPPKGVGEGIYEIQALPSEIKNKTRQMENMTKARDTGRLKDSHYWLTLDVAARELRSKYPGYREHIDSEFSRLAGGTPANRLMEALKAEERALNKEDNHWRNFVTKGVNDGNLDPRFYQVDPSFTRVWDKRTGQEMAPEAIINAVSQKESHKAQVKARGDDINLDLSEGKYRTEKAINLGTDIVKEEINDIYKSNGAWQDIQKRAAAQLQSGPTDPKAVEELSKQVAIMIPQERQRILSKVMSQDWAKQLKGEDVQKIMSYADDQFTRIQDLLHNKQIGLLNADKIHSEHMQESDKFNILSTVDRARILNAIRNVGGNEVANSFMLHTPTWMSGLQADLLNTLKLKALAGEGNLTQDLAQFRSKQGNVPLAESDRRFFAEVVNQFTQMAQDPALINNTQLAEKYVKYLYGSGMENFFWYKNAEGQPIQRFKSEQTPYLFSKMTTPMIAKNVFDTATRTGQKAIWENYGNFVERGFSQGVREPIQMIKSTTISRDGTIGLKWLPNEQRFDIETRQPQSTLPPSYQAKSVMAGLIYNAEHLNKYVQGIKAMFEAEGIKDVNEQNSRIAQMFAVNGLDITQMYFKKSSKQFNEPLFGQN